MSSPIVKSPFKHLESNKQLKLNKLSRSISPHLRNLDDLCYEDFQQSRINQQFRVHKAYPKNKYAVIIRKCQIHTDLAKYLHASCYGPVKLIFIKAIKRDS